MKVMALAFGATLFLGSTVAASAQTLLDDIIKRGTINVGVGLGTPPFGMTNDKMEPDGYDVELARKVARDLGVKINLVDTVASNRIPNITSGKLDMVIYSFSVTAERAKTIAFTNTVFVDQQIFLGPKGAALGSLADLKGKRVGVTRASTNDTVMTRTNPEGVTLQRYDDDASTTQALLAGQVDGIVTSNGLAVAVVGRNPSFETKFVVSQAPMSIGLKRGEHDFLHWLNTEIFMLWTNGEIQALQKKWMGAENRELPRF